MKIAQITFAYNNSKVINWLTKRGTLIKSEKWDKLHELEEEIMKQLKDDSEKYNTKAGKVKLLDLLQTPVSCFATFESEEGVNRARLYNAKTLDGLRQFPQKLLLKQDIEIQEASEPTDIIWENRHFTPTDRNIKRAIVYTIISIALAISAVIIYVMTKRSLELKFKYPKTDCSVFDAQYGVNSTSGKAS